MLILIDDANLELIQELYSKYPYDGVTTNPTILSKTGNNPMEQLKKIRALIPDTAQLHAQVISTKAEDMVKEAHHMLDNLGKNTFIKVPVTTEGIKAISILSKKGINITATAVYGCFPAFMAAKAGAKFVAPYVNRLDNLGYDGVQIAKDIHTMLKTHNIGCNVIGASFKNSQQVLDLCKFGIGAVTVAPDSLNLLTANGIAELAVESFIKDFEKLGGKTMLDF